MRSLHSFAVISLLYLTAYALAYTNERLDLVGKPKDNALQGNNNNLKKPVPFGNINPVPVQPPVPPPLANHHHQQPVQEYRNYLVTLQRTVTNTQKDRLLDKLLDMGAVVKQVYDYRVYKGVLFQVPPTLDKGLTSWTASLQAIDGVKEVELDQIIKMN